MDTSNRLWRILGMINFGLDAFILFFLLTATWIEIPPFLQVFGRAHPMVLHFPIVFIVLLPVIPWVLSALSVEKEYRHQFMGHYLTIAHFLCAVTVLFGLILSVEGGYSGEGVINHKWGGIVLLAILIFLENFRQFSRNQGNLSRFLLIIPAIALIVTSHIGSGITHGRDFLTEPIIRKSVKQAPLDQALVYRDVIHPILDQKCINCHNTSKSKGELVLEDSVSILRGGENGSIVVPGDLAESSMFQRLILDIDHDDHMPPKGKPQLTQTEILLIREWIAGEKLFDVAYSSLETTDTLAVLIRDNYDTHRRPVYDMKPAREEDILALNDNYRLLSPIARESPALYARFLSASHFENEHLTSLTKTRDQVVDLYLGHMPVGDEELSTVEQFSNLQVLNLNGTAITDQGLTHLYKLENLQNLYLTGTSVTEEGIRELLKSNPVKKLYLWDTQVDSNGMKNLNQLFPGTMIIGQSNPFGDQIIALNAPQITPKDAFFQTTASIKMDHPIPQVTIRYTTDGSDPDSLTSPVYETPLEFQVNTNLRIQAFKEGWLSSPILERSFYASRYTPDSSWFITPPHQRYRGEGILTVINLKSGEREHEDKSYLGYREENGICGFSFDNPVPLNKVVVCGITKTPSYIFPPYRLEVEVLDEGGRWHKAPPVQPDQPASGLGFEKYFITVPLGQELLASEVRIVVVPVPRLPDWHAGKGDKGWAFVDEILFQ